MATTRFAAASRLSATASPRLFAPSSNALSAAARRRCVFCRPAAWYSSTAAPDSAKPPTTATTPPLLAKLKGDLKAAMKAKDAPRLTVLRTILAATLNASKTAQPVRTDAQLVALLRKTARASQEAAAEFRGADRADLAEKEEAQIRVLEEYAQASGLASVSTEALRAAAVAVLAEVAADATGGSGSGAAAAAPKNATSEAIRRLLAPGGPLEGKDVDKGELVRIVKTLATQG